MIVRPGPSHLTGRGLIARHGLLLGQAVLNIRADRQSDVPLFHYVNHECAPTARVDRYGNLVTVMDLQAEREITINYLESCDFTEGFQCECGWECCEGWIEKEVIAGQGPRVPSLWLSGQVDAAVLTCNGRAI
jgi:hypothetical protein